MTLTICRAVPRSFMDLYRPLLFLPVVLVSVGLLGCRSTDLPFSTGSDQRPPVGKIKITVIQTTDGGDWHDTVDKSIEQARGAIREEHPDLILFPEAFCGYGYQPDQIRSEPIDGETVGKMIALAAEGKCLVLFGMLRSEDDGIHNSAILVDEKEVIGIYDKTHLYYHPGRPTHNEQKLYVRGESLGLFDTRLGRLGVMICHDGYYPEVPRALVLNGADVIFWLLNNGDCVSWAQGYARYCIVPLALANPNKGSGIVDGNRKVLCRSVEGEASAMTAEVDLARWREERATGYGGKALYRVRRPELYHSLLKPYPYAKAMDED